MNRRRYLKSVLFALLILMVIFGAAELLIRLAGLNPRVDNPFFMLVRVFEYPDYFEKDQTLFWRLRRNVDQSHDFLVPGSYRTNSFGLRGGEVDLASLAGETRIACLGNSCTFGWRLAEKDAYPGALQRELNTVSEQGQFVVFNCGVPGYSSYQGLHMLKIYQPALRPDYVTICYGWNDQWAGGFDIEDKDQQMAGQFLLDIQNMMSRSYLYRFIKYLLLARYEKQRAYTFDRKSPRYRVSLQDYYDNLAAMVVYCRQQGIIPILVTAPVGDADPENDLPYEIYHRLYNQTVLAVAAELDVALVDAAACFTDHPEFYDDTRTDYIHYNKRGAEWIAAQLAELIDNYRAEMIDRYGE
ncbi:MAG: hypothetical protein KAT58_07370 [candidate division Zixibacteria bacterium]|nr:hypothetical protein [candidate division Zixibacteria bacterium]